MSGFIVIVNSDHEPVDPSLLARMTQSMAYRGCDEQRTVQLRHVGLGSTLFRTTTEPAGQTQPFTLDSRVWIVGDVRLDGRADLLARFSAVQRRRLRKASDIELLLHAYLQWDDSVVDYLIGDFAFAVWDSTTRRLFCARDHIGIKPLFYGRLNGLFLLGNTLNTIRLHPSVSAELNERAIGDFLLFHRHHDLGATAFRDLARVPPAHALTLSPDTMSLRRYWEVPPVDRPTRRSAKRWQVLEEFDDLLRKAVEDRLRTPKVSILMSGGLDSPTLAATTRKLMHSQGHVDGVRAFCVVYSGMFDDPERTFAEIAARHLGVPLEFFHAADGAKLYRSWDDPAFNTPEPFHDPIFGNLSPLRDALARESRVVLDGFDGDALLAVDFDLYLSAQWRGGHLGQLFSDAVAYMRIKRSLPRLSTLRFLRRTRKLRQQLDPFQAYPRWLNPDFERRGALRERWHDVNSLSRVRHTHPGIHAMFADPIWPGLMEQLDPGFTRVPLEYRHPFCDLRLVDFCMRLPAIPWHARKHLLRELMRDVLPAAIRSRPKTPLVADPISILLAREGWRDLAPLAPMVSGYVNLDAIPRDTGGTVDDIFATLAPVSLGLWMTREGNRPMSSPSVSFAPRNSIHNQLETPQ